MEQDSQEHKFLSGNDTKVAGPSRQFILEGHSVLFKLPNGEVKSLKLEKNMAVSFGRFGTFSSNILIGQPYGMSYEIINKQLKVLPPKPMAETEDTEATNELINDGLVVQPLTVVDIEAFKQSGVHASEIIKRQIEQHANFSLKTEYSKDKYLKRKEAKYSKTFTVIEPTVYNICEYWFHKDRSRIREIRPDTLAQILNFANIRPGGRYIIVDDASGLLVGAALERIGREGKIITVCDVESPPAYPIVSQLNFDEELVNSIISSLNWATVDEDYTPILPPMEPSSGEFRSERQKQRLNKRKMATDGLFNTRTELFSGEFESLIVASEYDPSSIVEKLCPYLCGSASIVVHSPYVQTIFCLDKVLNELQAKLRALPQYLGPSVTEGWLRRYQVLPGRTHPTMNTYGTGGYILHAIYVYDDPSASSVMSTRLRNKRQKAEPPCNESEANSASFIS